MEQMIALSVPLLYVVGYTSPVVVSAYHVGPWTVQTHTEHMNKIFPRRWKDIRGGTIDEVWDAGCRAVMGILFMRPGIALVSNSSLGCAHRRVDDCVGRSTMEATESLRQTGGERPDGIFGARRIDRAKSCERGPQDGFDTNRDARDL